MHDEKLNTRSFARRASPRKDRLPPTYESGLFCHTCQTNQMLLTNLLSNYLPPPDDPEYMRRVQMLPEYQRSVETRYPPVCAECLPTVEDEIRKRDHMARTRALGRILGESRGSVRRRRVPTTQQQKDKLDKELTMWRARGYLWFGSLLCTMVGYLIVACGYNITRVPTMLRPLIPARAQFQGRAVRIRGKKEYSILQLVAWFPGVLLPLFSLIYCSASLGLELMILIRSCIVLRLQQPPAVRLTGAKSREQISPTPSVASSRAVTPAEPDFLASLSLSSKPVLPPPMATNPIFGHPSLPLVVPSSTTSPPSTGPIRESSVTMDIEDDDDIRDPDAMDWSPIKPPSPENARSTAMREDESWLRPQRFFAPEEPTGLENLFARTIRLADTSEQGTQGGRARSSSQRRFAWSWQWAVMLCIVPIVGVSYKAWELHKGKTIFTEI
ncbi:hypothetical protein A0H81_00999 [Grifola frondosa]|uniref:Ima1 N-terminal domain-containing protein n=1 Tax=Grifola frondosa TaxID=5627 RepID=A0A1C7MX80_GRIFR|nr:hypothetical protein A0H81_00999 [Grifola frondosa]